MTYEEMRLTLEHARSSALKIKALTWRIDETSLIGQRLTAVYGTERVSGGDAHSDPVYRAVFDILRSEQRLKDQMGEAVLRLQKGRKLISFMKDEKQRTILTDFYLCGLSYGTMRKMYGLTVNSSVYRILQRARDELFKQLPQK